jgi:hypothetical protein
MAVYFAFSDENGCYQRIRSVNFVTLHPYFIRSTLLIKADDWQELRSGGEALRAKLPTLPTNEIKWCHLWQLRRIERRNEQIDPNGQFHFLKDCTYQQLFDFVENSLAMLGTISFGRIILTISPNETCPKIDEGNLYKMHLQEAMQRLEMELDGSSDTCVFFVDSISPDHDKHLRNAYHAIYRDGDFIKKYQHIVDSLNLVYSHHSIGIQLADFIAGCFCGFLRGFPESIRLFKTYLSPLLRVGPNGQVLGYGVREVPRNQIFRAKLRENLTPKALDILDDARQSFILNGGLW